VELPAAETCDICGEAGEDGEGGEGVEDPNGRGGEKALLRVEVPNGSSPSSSETDD